jgi:hypothetical protein
VSDFIVALLRSSSVSVPRDQALARAALRFYGGMLPVIDSDKQKPTPFLNRTVAEAMPGFFYRNSRPHDARDK